MIRARAVEKRDRTPVRIEMAIKNTDRTAGAMLSGAIAKRHGHEGLRDAKVRADGGENLQDRGNVIHQRNIHSLEPGPERKAAVGEDEGVGVADLRQ